MATIFDLITLFGLTGFFGWLAFAALQAEQLVRFGGDKIQQARRNLYVINSYFLVSFLFNAVAAIGYYLYHNPGYLCFGFYEACYHSPLIFLVMAGSFVNGFITLGIPIWYVQLVMKGDCDWHTVNPPPLMHTLVVSAGTAFGVVLAIVSFRNAQTAFGKGMWFLLGIGGIVGARFAIKYWNDLGWKRAGGAILILLVYLLWMFFTIENLPL